MKKTIFYGSALLFCLTLISCGKNNLGNVAQNPVLENCSIHHDDEFGGAYIDISIDNFNRKGFNFGDSVNLVFVTGEERVTFEDIGYYSGYYVPAGQELVVGYKGYDCIKFCINYGEDVYAENDFSLETKVTIILNESQKYKNIEDTLSISYSDLRDEYESDEQFANFREVKGGNLKEGLFYRGASPLDNSRKRSEIVDSLLRKNGIAYNIDLADKKENIYSQSKYQVHEYMQGLIDDDKASFLVMSAAYKAEDFAGKMKAMFLAIAENEGPFYIHCLEGKDRTGYVCMVIEALCGDTYEELVHNYFITYKNYYGIEEGTDKYELIREIHIDEMIRYVFGFNKSDKLNLLGASLFQSVANGYLLNIGLNQDQIDALEQRLSK